MKNLEGSKQRAAQRALEMIKDGQIIGLGTGSTAKFAIEGVGQLVREGMDLKAVPTSIATEKMARQLGIPLVELNATPGIDITIDGADEVDPAFNMIKGGGGALTREKLVALASKQRVILVDETKLVSCLGQTRLLPVEVLPVAWTLSARHLADIGGVASLRDQEGKPFVTDNGNYILDCGFGEIVDPPALEKQIRLLPGVVESGLFIGIADVLVIGYEDRVELKQRVA